MQFKARTGTHEFRKKVEKLFFQKTKYPYLCRPKNGYGSVVQLVRMPPCHGGGRGFESRPVRN